MYGNWGWRLPCGLTAVPLSARGTQLSGAPSDRLALLRLRTMRWRIGEIAHIFPRQGDCGRQERERVMTVRQWLHLEPFEERGMSGHDCLHCVRGENCVPVPPRLYAHIAMDKHSCADEGAGILR